MDDMAARVLFSESEKLLVKEFFYLLIIFDKVPKLIWGIFYFLGTFGDTLIRSNMQCPNHCRIKKVLLKTST